MALYLKERELGFDPTTIGFPSIHGCMAIVYVVPNGLFGYHNYGGSANAAWADRANAFNSYVQHHILRGAASRLYGVTFVGLRYGPPQQDNWVGELTSFAGALGYNGKIRGYDLSGDGMVGSAYVEFRKVNDKCEIWVKPWTAGGEATNVDKYNHKTAPTRSGVTVVENKDGQVFVSVNPANMRHMHSQRLRG